jgi:hypothetical protein
LFAALGRTLPVKRENMASVNNELASGGDLENREGEQE